MARKKKGGGHEGGHGWFVTFADLMALLMSFFVMIAAYSTQDQKKLQLVAGSMRDAFGATKESRYAGIVEADGIPTRTRLAHVRVAPPEDGADRTTPSELSRNDDGLSVTAFDRRFGLAAASLRQALQDMPEIAELSKDLIVEQTRDGLNVSMVDQDGRAMFPEGSTQPNDRTRQLLQRLAPTLRRMPNRLQITGHTSANKPGQRPLVSPWELSTGRAAVVRELLATGGIPDDRFAAVTGRADTDPLFPDNPGLPANRRVTVTLLNEAPPVPFGAKP